MTTAITHSLPTEIVFGNAKILSKYLTVSDNPLQIPDTNVDLKKFHDSNWLKKQYFEKTVNKSEKLEIRAKKLSDLGIPLDLQQTKELIQVTKIFKSHLKSIAPCNFPIHIKGVISSQSKNVLFQLYVFNRQEIGERKDRKDFFVIFPDKNDATKFVDKGYEKDVYHGWTLNHAVKHVALAKSTLTSELKIIHAKAESHYLNMLNNSQHSVKLLRSASFGNNRILVMNYYPSELYTCFEKLPPNLRFTIAIEIAKAVKYLHDRKIAHRDLKMENILIKENSAKIRLCDFSYAAAENDGIDNLNEFAGTVDCLTLDALEKKYPPLTFKVAAQQDIWALGVQYWDIFFPEEMNERPWHKYMKECQNTKKPYDIPSICLLIKYFHREASMDEKKIFFKKMMALDPATRPTIDQVIEKLNEMYKNTIK